MATSLKPQDLVNIIILGGTGAQGLSVVQALAPVKKYNVSVLTRDVQSPKAIEVQSKYGVNLIEGSYTTEAGLRAALQNQDVCYFNMDAFSVGEPQEYFWTFRAYEIAVQCRLKWFIHSGGEDRFAQHGYSEDYRNSHNIVAGRLGGWLAAQPTERLPWSILSGGVYAEMLNTLLRPRKDEEGVVTFAAPMREGSVIPLIPLEMYGVRVRWMLENPQLSIGRYVSAGPFPLTYPDIVEAFEKVNKIPARFQPVLTEEWMERVSPFVDVDKNLPRGSSKDDPTTFTFRKSFTAWWNLWRDNIDDPSIAEEAAAWADEYYPTRAKSIEEWMRNTGYGKGFV